MRAASCFVLFYFYVFTSSSKPRSVNLALETTFEFDNKQDVEIIEKVRKFLNKIENVVDAKLALRSGRLRNAKMRNENYSFSDFLQELLTTLNSYNDKDFKEVFEILHEEIRSHRSESKFGELIESVGLRHVLTEELNNFNAAPAHFLRRQVKKLSISLKSKRGDKQNTDFIHFLNFLYKRKSAGKLKNISNKFKLFGRRSANSELNLKNIIRNAIKSLIYDHYSNLDESVRRDVRTWLETVSKDYKINTTKKKPKDFLYIEKDMTTRKSISKIHSSHKKKINTIVRPRQTFVTLYPEAINFKTNKKLDKISSLPSWKERAAPNNNNFYLVKEFDSNLNRRRDKEVMNEDDNEEVNQSVSKISNSLEFVWRAPDLRRKELTAALENQFRNRQNKSTTTLSRQAPSKRLTIDKTTFHRAHKLQRKSHSIDNDLLNKTANYTYPKETVSEKYLNRIKRIEEELNQMKNEINAKISSTMIPKETDKLIDEYSDYVGREEEIYQTTIPNTVAFVALKNVTSMVTPDITTKSDAIFRSYKQNNTKENELSGDVYGSQELIESVQNVTVGPINITSKTVIANTDKNILNVTNFTDDNIVTIALPVSESDTRILTEEANAAYNNTFTQIQGLINVDTTAFTVLSANMSTLGYVEAVSNSI